MGAIASHTTATSSAPWDAAAQEAKLKTPLSQSAARGFYAWKEGDGWPTTKSAYRFGHHMVASNGDPGAANLKACSAGIAVLNGGRGGTSIPASDRKGVYAHLARHLKDAGMNPAPLQGAEADDMEATMMHDDNVPGLLPLGRTTWAVDPATAPMLVDLHRRVDASMIARAGDALTAATAAANGRSQPMGKVAVIGLSGVLTPRPSLMTLLFGGSAGGLQGFRSAFREAMGNVEVEGVVINCDSPGGRESLIPETAAEVAAADKPVVAVVNTLCASAAYWIASQADEIVTTPSGEAGSIGVYAMHLDWSAANDKAGVKPTIISAGKYKAEANEEEPLDPEAEAAWQEQIDEIYGEFVDAVASGRGVTAGTVKDGYGEGRALRAQPAITAGLVDGMATLGQAVAGMLSGSGAAHAAVPASIEGIERERRAAAAERDANMVPVGAAADEDDPNAEADDGPAGTDATWVRDGVNVLQDADDEHAADDGDDDADADEDTDGDDAGDGDADASARMTRAEVLFG